ncbi:MAG TPA: hypothetical protein VNX67_07445 [Solirubrobacteraceae bacterium]|nr:hypothetical protein [Solirubrobacteraceae bacterium]
MAESEAGQEKTQEEKDSAAGRGAHRTAREGAHGRVPEGAGGTTREGARGTTPEGAGGIKPGTRGAAAARGAEDVSILFVGDLVGSIGRHTLLE